MAFCRAHRGCWGAAGWESEWVTFYLSIHLLKDTYKHTCMINAILRVYNTRRNWEEDALQLTQKWGGFNQKMRVGRVSEVERAVCAHWKQGGCGTLGKSTHNLSLGECVNMRTWGWRGRWGGNAYYLVCSGLVCSSRLCPGPSWGPQAAWERNITCRHGCWQDQITRLSAIFHLESSLLLSVCFHQLWVSLRTLTPWRVLDFHPWLNHDSGLFSGGSKPATQSLLEWI